MCPQLHHVSSNGGSCPPSYLPLFAGTSRKSLEKKWSHMPELCSTLRSRKTHQRRINHALWQKASIAELRREVEFYLSFMDEEDFGE